MATSTVGDLVVWNDTTATEVTSEDPTTYLRFVEDFLTGSTSAPDVGQSWNYSAGAASWVASETDHPGIFQRSTGTTINTLAYMTSRTFQTTGVFDPASTFDITHIVRLNTNDADTTVRLGLSSDWNNLSAANGIYVEKLGTDTQWFGVTRASSSQTRTAALASSTTNWVKFRIRRVNGTTIGFTIDGGAEVTATATIPTAMMQVGNHITNLTAAAKTIDFDLIRLNVYGLTR